jgi:hypothetical protein
MAFCRIATGWVAVSKVSTYPPSNANASEHHSSNCIARSRRQCWHSATAIFPLREEHLNRIVRSEKRQVSFSFCCMQSSKGPRGSPPSLSHFANTSIWHSHSKVKHSPRKMSHASDWIGILQDSVNVFESVSIVYTATRQDFFITPGNVCANMRADQEPCWPHDMLM